jgi:hypothetical protein
LEALERDIEDATTDALDSLEIDELSAKPLSLEQSRVQTKILAFQKMAKTLISREGARRAHSIKKEDSADGTPDKDATNGDTPVVQIKEEEQENIPESRTVLTLFGSAQGPKQLFSSLQKPIRVRPAHSSGIDTSVNVTLPLRESTLPNIITTTEVYPLPDTQDENKKRKPKTFGELYGAPSHVPQLSPPKPARPQTAKGNTVTFAQPEPAPKSSRKGTQVYANQNLATGHWLGYGGVDVPKDPTSPTAKQKSRQRALSTGEAQQPRSEEILAKVQQAKEDALFRSAYSSFAPSRDDATAIVPEETKNKVWWQKYGEKRFKDQFPAPDDAIDPVLLALEDSTEPEVNGEAEEADIFKEAVETFEPVGEEPFETTEKSDLEKNTDEVLQEISELLATLASHQRIRNLSLATNPRTPVIQNSSLASLAGSPSTPSSEEIDVYQMLKSQLTLMISQLPPYAVAKLNGDQLDDLNISRTIIIETEDHKGVLEEDQLARRAAMPAAAPPSLTRMASSSSTTHYPGSTQYARTPSVHTSTRPAQPTPGYYQQPAVQRSPSMHYHRSSSGPTQSYQTPAPAYGNNAPRPGYGPSQYGQQTPSRSFNQATPGTYYSQRPAATPSNYGGVPNSQFYQSTPQTQPHRYQQQTAQNGYYQRPQNPTGYSYNAAPSPQVRTGSPLKAGPVPQPSFPSRPGYGTPVSGGQIRSTYYPPGGSQFGTPQAPAPQAPMAHNTMGSSQQMMLDRQQQQQSQARMAAQNSFHRNSSGTPQPPNPQYNGQQPNGTPMAT